MSLRGKEEHNKIPIRKRSGASEEAPHQKPLSLVAPFRVEAARNASRPLDRPVDQSKGWDGRLEPMCGRQHVSTLELMHQLGPCGEETPRPILAKRSRSRNVAWRPKNSNF